MLPHRLPPTGWHDRRCEKSPRIKALVAHPRSIQTLDPQIGQSNSRLYAGSVLASSSISPGPLRFFGLGGSRAAETKPDFPTAAESGSSSASASITRQGCRLPACADKVQRAARSLRVSTRGKMPTGWRFCRGRGCGMCTPLSARGFSRGAKPRGCESDSARLQCDRDKTLSPKGCSPADCLPC